MSVIVNERNGKPLRVEFTYQGQPSLPSSVHWNQTCNATNKVLQSDTALDV